MSSDKQIKREKLPDPEKRDTKHQKQENFGHKATTEKVKAKKTHSRRDLPIY